MILVGAYQDAAGDCSGDRAADGADSHPDDKTADGIDETGGGTADAAADETVGLSDAGNPIAACCPQPGWYGGEAAADSSSSGVEQSEQIWAARGVGQA